MATQRKSAARKAAARKRPAKQWSQAVSDSSDAMDLEQGVFKQRSAKKIAESLKASAERSNRRKAGPFQSAMSMLNFYINRAGQSLSAAQRSRLGTAKAVLRRLFGKPEPAAKKPAAPAAKKPAAPAAKRQKAK